MKKNLKVIYLLIWSFCSFLLPSIVSGQIKKAFTQRTSPLNGNRAIYNVRGDMAIFGNSNLTSSTYSEDESNSNNPDMIYVDVDFDNTTANSSSSTLIFNNENGASIECSSILYAGLYWTGRTHTGTNTASPLSFTSNSNRTRTITEFNQISHNNNVSVGTTSQTFTIPQVSNYNNITIGNGVYNRVRYQINGVQFELLVRVSGTGDEFLVRYRVSTNTNVGNNSDFTILNVGSFLVTNSRLIYTFPREYPINNSAIYYIRELSRDISLLTNFTDLANHRNGTNGILQAHGSFTMKTGNTNNGSKVLHKQFVRLKGPGATSYDSVQANTSDILYPSTTSWPDNNDGIYVGYAEVTSYVKAHGFGQYTVADIAVQTGNGGEVGYFGGWTMVVIYENNKMEYRDITVFDGFGYMYGGTTHTLPIVGFKARQEGPVRVKIGMMAAEGDRSITGDYFRILNKSTNSYDNLSHSQNSTNNFFNSSINVGENVFRIPNITNNTGLDMSMFFLNNNSYNYIRNKDSTTSFQFGSTGDTYVIPMIAMSVDAYVPDMNPINRVASVNGVPYDPILHDEIAPRDTIEYRLVMQNTGSETINNLEMKIALPLPVNFLSMQYQYIDTNTVGFPAPVFDSIDGVRGSIKWGTIDSFPRPDRYGDTFAILTYKVVATDDCYVLMNPDCAPVAAVQGYARGVGAISQVTIDSLPFIYGFQTSGACIGAPITTPEQLKINGVDFVRDSCGTNQSMVRFVKCNGAPNAPASVVPISELEPFFPNGSVYSNTYPATTLYTSGLPYPTNVGDTLYYYAIPPVGSLECYFKIMVANYQQPQYIDHDYDCREDWVQFETNPAPAVDGSVIFKILETYRHGLVRDTVDRVNNTGYFTGLRGVDSLVFIVENIACAMEPLGINFELCDGALAVNFQSFTAKKNNSMVALDWTTTNEVGVVAYNVEHSTNSRDFNSIGKVAVSTSTDLVKQYHYLHKNPAPGLNYYRIKENDDQGFSTYSIIKIVDFEKHISIDIFPNPVQEQLNVRLVAEKEEKVNYWIANAAMQQVNLHDNNAYMMTNTTNAIDIADFTSGIYFLMFKLADGTIVHHKFVVDK